MERNESQRNLNRLQSLSHTHLLDVRDCDYRRNLSNHPRTLKKKSFALLRKEKAWLAQAPVTATFARLLRWRGRIGVGRFSHSPAYARGRHPPAPRQAVPRRILPPRDRRRFFLQAYLDTELVDLVVWGSLHVEPGTEVMPR